MSKKEDNFHKQKRNLFPTLNEEDLDLKKESPSEDNSKQTHYSQEELIASGGLKNIFRARDQRTGRYIAMAKLKPEFKSHNQNERFLREARTLANLEHSNIVPLHDINHEENGELYFTMKLLSGETFASILRKIKQGDENYARNYPLRKRLEILLRVCDAIIYAHSKEVAHLDIKPENIQISEFGEVFVIDWGLAKLLDEKRSTIQDDDSPDFMPLSNGMTLIGQITGTPGYMSPEQCIQSEIEPGKPSDIYSLGATLYAIIYLNPPFDSLKKEVIIEKAGDGSLPNFPESAQGRRVPDALKAISAKSMAANANDRYHSVKDLKHDIELYLNDFATNAEGITFLRLCRLFLKRHYTKAVLSLLTLFIITIISYFSISTIQEKEAKLRATADDAIFGTLEKDVKLRSEGKFNELIKHYEQLISLGYDYPIFKFNLAKLYAGNLELNRAFKLLSDITKVESNTKNSKDFQEFYSIIDKYIKESADFSERKALIRFVNEFSDTEDHETNIKSQIFYTINSDTDLSLDDKLKTLRIYLNKTANMESENLNYNYSSNLDGITIDLSDNPNLTHIFSLYGLPIRHLDISKTNIGISGIFESPILMQTLKSINCSNSKDLFTQTFIIGSNIEKLIVKYSPYAATNLSNNPQLKYLDVEGSDFSGHFWTPSNSLEFLNISHSNFHAFLDLLKFTGLKTLIIDSSMMIDINIINALKDRGVDIITQEKKTIYHIEAEDYISMHGILTKNTGDTGGGLLVGWLHKGDYMTYNLNTNKEGKYEVSFRVSGHKFHFQLLSNNKTISIINENGTGSYDKWTTLRRTINLKKGINNLRFEALNEGIDLNWIKLEYLSNN